MSPNRLTLCIASIMSILSTGCSERLNRENVFANTETGIGIFVAENAKTQMYEAKLGFFRHELFFVPTSKTITYKNTTGQTGLLDILLRPRLLEQEVEHHDPSETPEVLAELVVDGGATKEGATKESKFGVRQRLAVGKLAVESPSAFILMAGDSVAASDVAKALGGKIESETERRVVIGAIGAAWAGLDKLADAGNKEAKRHKENLDALATHKDLASAKGVPVIRSAEPDTADNTKLNVKIALAGHLVSEASFNDILVVSNRLSKSIEALKKVEKHGEQSGNKVVGTTEPSNASGLEKSMADSIASSDPNQARFARDYLKSQNEQALASLEELTRRNQAVIDAMKYFASQVAPQEK